MTTKIPKRPRLRQEPERPKPPRPRLQKDLEPVAEPAAITPAEYGGQQQAFDHFNRILFGGQLPDVFITYQRKAHSRGYFAADRFASRLGKGGRHELALNPDSYLGRTDKQANSTLVHEMVHLRQHCFGKPSARGYHNREWGSMMKEIGLYPSSTEAPGGKETGYRVTHYILDGGAFDRAHDELAATGWKLNLQSAPRPGATGRNSKTKFTCPQCRQNAWGKPELSILCRPCELPMLTDEAVPSYDQAA
jgi:hypothetical protein